MILNKLKNIIREFRGKIEILYNQNEIIKAQNSELEWAHIFHDTIKGRVWLQDLAISPGRWAGSYSFFYILSRILIDYKPTKILEFGLGESSKFVSSMIDNELKDSTHIIIEHSYDWIIAFNTRFKLAANSKIKTHEITSQKFNDFECLTYKNLVEYSDKIMDLYLVDGISSDRYSRFYILDLLVNVKSTDEFIIIIDDYERVGEKDTANELINFFEAKKINIHKGVYSGSKGQLVIATEKYKFSVSF